MNAKTGPWVIVVIADPVKGSRKASAEAVDGPEATLQRALSLTVSEKVCCVIASSFSQEWSSVYEALRSVNRYSLSTDEPVLEGVRRCLAAIDIQEPKANVTVIPYNHCAAEPTSWLDSAKSALRLGRNNRNTVYLLHDNPENDPRIALKKPEVCTSSVMIGSSRALLALCVGARTTKVVDLLANPAAKPAAESHDSPRSESGSSGEPLNVVHIRLLEEYERLRRINARQSSSQRVDILV